MGDNFGNHRIVVRRDTVSPVSTPDRRAVPRPSAKTGPRSGPSKAGTLAPDLLRRRAPPPHGRRNAPPPATAARLAGGDTELPLHEIETRDRFRHWMFDLKPGVHLHEPDAVGAQPVGGIGDELDRPRADIVHGQRGTHGRLAQHGTHAWRHARRRRFLDHLLMSSLQRTVALIQDGRMALAVGKNLDLDVAWRATYFSISTRSSAKAKQRLPPAAFQGGLEIGVTDRPAAGLGPRRRQSP